MISLSLSDLDVLPKITPSSSPEDNLHLVLTITLQNQGALGLENDKRP
jgi:hypothetical protein